MYSYTPNITGLYITKRRTENLQLIISIVFLYVVNIIHNQVQAQKSVGLWESCSKYPSLFYSEFLSKFLHYAQFYSFYAAPSIIIPYLQFKLSINGKQWSYKFTCNHAQTIQ